MAVAAGLGVALLPHVMAARKDDRSGSRFIDHHRADQRVRAGAAAPALRLGKGKLHQRGVVPAHAALRVGRISGIDHVLRPARRVPQPAPGGKPQIVKPRTPAAPGGREVGVTGAGGP